MGTGEKCSVIRAWNISGAMTEKEIWKSQMEQGALNAVPRTRTLI